LVEHQDTITWTALSVFLSAEFILLALLLQALVSSSSTLGTVSSVGLFLTIVSLQVFRRSNAYMDAYFDLLKERCHPADLPIFSVKPAVSGSTRFALTMLHVVLLAIYGVVTAGYFAVAYLGYKP